MSVRVYPPRDRYDIAHTRDDVPWDDYIAGDNDEEPVMSTTTGNPYQILQDLGKRLTSPYTPDYMERKMDDNNLVFVYGTLKLGERNHHWLEDAAYLGEARTVLSSFNLLDYDGGFPVAKRVHSNHEYAGVIYGDAFVVKPDVLAALDRLEGNGFIYQREQTWVGLLEQTEPKKTESGVEIRACKNVKAWMYLGVPAFWDKVRLTQITPKKTEGKSGTVNLYNYYGNKKAQAA